jgi:TRAP-type mannitol/chloroaromatic compound transport system permease small subunit
VVRAIERASEYVGLCGAFLLVPLVLATCYEVFARYLFLAPTIWAYEVGYTLTGAHFLLGMAFTLKYGAHIRIDLFSGVFSARTRAFIDLAGYTVVLPLTVWLALHLFYYFWSAWLTNERSGMSALNMVVWPLRAVFFLAFVLLALQIVAEVAKLVRVLRTTPARD